MALLRTCPRTRQTIWRNVTGYFQGKGQRLTEMHSDIRANGNMHHSVNFGQPDPCRSIFSRFMSRFLLTLQHSCTIAELLRTDFFQPIWDMSTPSRQNVGITISNSFPLPQEPGKPRKVVNKTDNVYVLTGSKTCLAGLTIYFLYQSATNLGPRHVGTPRAVRLF